jgi:ABC-type multidrug transport system permease subunit
MVVGILVVALVASSGFVPVGVLPGWLQGFSTGQPFTQFVHAARSLVTHGTVHVSGSGWVSLAWGVCVLLGVVALAVRRGRGRRAAA